MIRKSVLLNRVIYEITQKPLFLNRNLYHGTVVEFWLAQKLTKFDIYKILYSLRSKKQRSNAIQVRSGGMLNYRYMGKILRLKNPFKDKLESGVILRNVVDLVSFEILIKIFSPLITKMASKVLDNTNMRGYSRSNNYFLRWDEPVKSKSEFNYVI